MLLLANIAGLLLATSCASSRLSCCACLPPHVCALRIQIIGTLLASKPEGYDLAYRELAERGMRVLALASRALTPAEEDGARRAAASGRGPAREDIEKGLQFEGFVAFVCKVRADARVLPRAHTRGGIGRS